MEELFATKIVINKLLNIEGFEIPLSETERKHLIITGKNGSGKTTLLNELSTFVRDFIRERNRYGSGVYGDEAYKNIFAARLLHSFTDAQSQIVLNYPNATRVEFDKGNFIFKFFLVRRDNLDKDMVEPIGPKKLDEFTFYNLDEKTNKDFIQFLFNKKADAAFAKLDSEEVAADAIDVWFNHFEKSLFELFELEGAKLKFDSKRYRFIIEEKNKPPYSLTELPDGFYAMLDIVSELIMRMRKHEGNSYDLPGIVLIDEIETHLHIALQKKILPFLISFFPRIQFIVTTHSPFVISSVSNAVICDLEKKIVTEDLSGYSYEAIVESYFDVDQYSEELKNEVKEYEQLMGRRDLDDTEKERMLHLDKYLHDLPKFASNGLAAKIQQIKLKHLKEKAA